MIFLHHLNCRFRRNYHKRPTTTTDQTRKRTVQFNMYKCMMEQQEAKTLLPKEKNRAKEDITTVVICKFSVSFFSYVVLFRVSESHNCN
ncbi:hypothetical protein CARUB_v10002352mg [Capsella rubella]|uniref:Uncharacterized protein n=1 Tax=Capsella rubella TaxID=81985 RepID=R0HA54_9BRAS|nr:hypothetical protein CARUB_v10002352mg [Capsella rubella]